ncbi:MAG: ribose 5-phosphate isomerase A [Archaeoglobus sp.]|nr:ribose 5-phosphate isomerase A [Archaeoglobus sp.]
MGVDEEKIVAAKKAAELVDDGMVIGLGTGSTIEFFIKEVGERIKREEIEIWCVPSSYQSHMLAAENGFFITDLFQVGELDACIDGADQVDSELNCIKGKGGALLREKIIAQASEKVYIIVDSRKLSEKLSKSVPIEVLPYAYGSVVKKIERIGGKVMLRESKTKIGPCITDNGNFILDVDFGILENPSELERELNGIAGVIENGIFPSKLISAVIVGGKDEKAKILKKES